jgi:hypothetical protein
MIAVTALLLVSSLTLSTASAASSPAAGADTTVNWQETEQETPNVFDPDPGEGTTERVYITLAVISLVGITLMGLALGLWGYLSDK